MTSESYYINQVIASNSDFPRELSNLIGKKLYKSMLNYFAVLNLRCLITSDVTVPDGNVDQM
ncbi:CLUMA_CG011247, isoform A [Clunio marinus]|uniref:CLUMA_CG011247, isoform A n=1 Tax=Clunio marinus TaxID=568069 RepID=A0A1J1ICB7_9DIPT|nr:CLUMA_CG011247, isoform A [Clunio marinus]